jgi:hypothetical protein
MAFFQYGGRTRSAGIGVCGALLGVLLSASRTPIIAGLVMYARTQRLRATQLLLVGGLLFTVAAGASLLMPDLWTVTKGRFEAVVGDSDIAENSAADRLRIALNSPVFEVDDYWLVGHGHSSYRFIAEQHLSRFTRGVSRSLYNFWLTVWYDAGPLGVFLWAAFLYQLHRILGRIARLSAVPEVKALALGLIGALWGLGAASLFGEIPYNWRVMGVFYNSVGVCFAVAHWSAGRHVFGRVRRT